MQGNPYCARAIELAVKALNLVLVCVASLRLKRHIYGPPIHERRLNDERVIEPAAAAAAAERTDAVMTMTSLMDAHFISFRRSFSDVINPTSIMLCHTKHADPFSMPATSMHHPTWPVLLYHRIVSTGTGSRQPFSILPVTFHTPTPLHLAFVGRPPPRPFR